jgi:Probable Zinc-ribbon domain/ROS/MUCR transcriptional regulator protein
VSARALSQPRLADGTPYVGELGTLAYDPDEDRVQCHLCGGWYRILGGAHLRRSHGWTLVEYRDAFQLPMQLPACSHEFSQHKSVLAASLIARGGNFGKGTGVSPERHSRVRPWRSLASAHPELVAELDPERNEDLGDPAAIGAHSSRRLWWRCAACDHRWQATVGSRSAGHGCRSATTSVAAIKAHARRPPNDRFKLCVPT